MSEEEKRNWAGIGMLGLIILIIIGSVSADIPGAFTDKLTNALVTIDYSHHEIHEGSHYKQGYQITGLLTGETVALVFTTPNTAKWAHWTLTAQTTGKVTVQLFRAPTLSAQGTALTPLNRNENVNNPATTIVRHTPTITDNGVKLVERWIGGTGFKFDIGGELRGSSEIILKQNTQYLVLCTAQADDVDCAIGGDWYEHTNK